MNEGQSWYRLQLYLQLHRLRQDTTKSQHAASLRGGDSVQLYNLSTAVPTTMDLGVRSWSFRPFEAHHAQHQTQHRRHAYHPLHATCITCNPLSHGMAPAASKRYATITALPLAEITAPLWPLRVHIMTPPPTRPPPPVLPLQPLRLQAAHQPPRSQPAKVRQQRARRP